MTDPTRRQIAMMADEVGITDHAAACTLVRRAFEVSRSARAALAEPGPEDDVALLREALLATAAQRRAEDDARIALAADGPAVQSRETASVVGESIDVEQVAQQVFEAMRFSGATSPAPPEWVPGGNSLMQDHARDVARAILTRWGHQPAPPVAGEVGEGVTDEELGDLWSWAAAQDQGPWPTQQHCFARAVLARWGRQPAPPAAGEVGELVAWLRAWALGTMEEGQPATSRSLTRAAELLEQRQPDPPAAGAPCPSMEDVGPLIAWLAEQACQAADASQPTDAGMLTWAAQVIGERVDEDAPAPPIEGEVAELVARLRRASDGASAMGWEQDSWVIARAAELLAQRHPEPVPALPEDATVIEPVPVAERLPELRGMFERILCVARSSGQRPVGNIELADRLIGAVVSWAALPLPAGEVAHG